MVVLLCLDLFWTVVSFSCAIITAVFRFFISPREKSVVGENVLITGGGGGIGRLMAVEFAKKGAVVVIWDIDPKGSDQTAQLVKNVGGKIFTYTVDVSDKAAVKKAATVVLNEVGDIDILINNAGIVSGQKILDCPDELVEKTFRVNTFAHFWTTRAFLSAMLQRRHGHVVYISSIAGLVGLTGLTDYCASKSANIGLFESLNLELIAAGQNKIQTTLVCPYFMNTGLFTGCKDSRFPRVLPTLNPDQTVSRIMKAILTNQKQLYIPRMMYFMALAKAVLPVDAQLALHKFLGASNFMDTYVGRKNAPLMDNKNK